MTELPGSVRPLVERYQTVLSDLDGVVYRSTGAVPHAVAALAEGRAAGHRPVFVTNGAARTPAQVAKLLTSLGVPARDREVVTAGEVVARLAAAALPAGSRVLVVGAAAVRDALRRHRLVPVRRSADRPAAVVQALAPELTWRELEEATYAVAGGAAWFATHDDPVVPRAGGLAPGPGPLIDAIRTVTGREPVVAGKPHPGIVDAARLDRPGPFLMVGDGLATDIEGANRHGVDSLLVLTGVTTVRDLLAAPPSRRPTYLAADLRGLLVPHPPVWANGTDFHCGGWTATVRGEEVALARSGSRADPVDGLRALCRAVWAARDTASVAPTPAPPPLPISLEDLEEFCTL